jgi:hypothetical protein
LVVSATEGEMLSQLGTPLGTDALAVKLVALPAVTERGCGAGAPPPAVALKFRDVGLRVTLVEASATVSFTPTVCLPRDVRREIVSLYVPAASPEGFTETVKSWLVYRVPEGEMLNQFALAFRSSSPAGTETRAVNWVRLEARTDNVWAGGAPPPAVALKFSGLPLPPPPSS